MCFIVFHFVSFCFILFHFVSFHFVSFCFILFHFVSFCFTGLDHTGRGEVVKVEVEQGGHVQPLLDSRRPAQVEPGVRALQLEEVKQNRDPTALEPLHTLPFGNARVSSEKREKKETPKAVLSSEAW
jgi:hypothetical protein